MSIELETQLTFVGARSGSPKHSVDAPAALERCRDRLRDLAALPDRWDDEGAHVIDANALRTAEALLARRPLLSAAYTIFPTAPGGVLFEFVANGWDLSIEVLTHGAIELFGFEEEGNAELLPLAYPEVSSEFIERLDMLVGQHGK